MKWNCCENYKPRLVTESFGSGYGGSHRETVSVCANCGNFHVGINRNGDYRDMNFRLYSSELIIAAMIPYNNLVADEGELQSETDPKIVLSDVLGYLHIINSEAGLIRHYTDDPNLNLKKRAKNIETQRLKAHEKIVQALQILKEIDESIEVDCMDGAAESA